VLKLRNRKSQSYGTGQGSRVRIGLLHFQQLSLPNLVDFLPFGVVRQLLVVYGADASCLRLHTQGKARGTLLSKAKPSLHSIASVAHILGSLQCLRHNARSPKLISLHCILFRRRWVLIVICPLDILFHNSATAASGKISSAVCLSVPGIGQID